MPRDPGQIRQLFLRESQRLPFRAQVVLHFYLSDIGFHAGSDRIIDIMSGIIY